MEATNPTPETPPTPAPPPGTVDTRTRVRQAVAAAEDRKAIELRVLHLEKISDFTDYFVICSGTSERQVQAIADAVQEKMREERVRPLHVEGFSRGQWVLLDYGDFVVHIFQDEPRRFYSLERLWGDAPDVTGEFRSTVAE
jgi:ribosome-associated protein